MNTNILNILNILNLLNVLMLRPASDHCTLRSLVQPLPRQEQNGPGFYYKVGYRQLSSNTMLYANVTNPNASELVIFDQKNTFQEYEILVQSVNEKGKAPIKNDDRRKGYSGEGSELPVLLSVRFVRFKIHRFYISWVVSGLQAFDFNFVCCSTVHQHWH